MDEIRDILESELKGSEIRLNELIAPLSDNNSLDFEFCKDQFFKVILPELHSSCQNTAIQIRNKRITEPIIIAENKHILEKITPVLENAHHMVYVCEYKRRLDQWRIEQIIMLQEKLQALIPNHDYFSAYNEKRFLVTSSEGKRQAKELAEEIVNLVYDLLMEIYSKEKTQPSGGHWGNIQSVFCSAFRLTQTEMQCSDWAEFFFNMLQEPIANWFIEKKNSFSVQWIHNPGFIPYSPDILNFGEHNLIRIHGPLGCILIDPWDSGGKTILGNNKQEYENKKTLFYSKDGLEWIYPFPQKGSYFINLNIKGKKGKFPPRDRMKSVLERSIKNN